MLKAFKAQMVCKAQTALKAIKVSRALKALKEQMACKAQTALKAIKV